MVEQAAGQDSAEQGMVAPKVKRLLAGLAAGAAMLAGSFAGLGPGDPPEAAANNHAGETTWNSGSFCPPGNAGVYGYLVGDYCWYWAGGSRVLWVWAYDFNYGCLDFQAERYVIWMYAGQPYQWGYY